MDKWIDRWPKKDEKMDAIIEAFTAAATTTTLKNGGSKRWRHFYWSSFLNPPFLGDLIYLLLRQPRANDTFSIELGSIDF